MSKSMSHRKEHANEYCTSNVDYVRLHGFKYASFIYTKVYLPGMIISSNNDQNPVAHLILHHQHELFF